MTIKKKKQMERNKKKKRRFKKTPSYFKYDSSTRGRGRGYRTNLVRKKAVYSLHYKPIKSEETHHNLF